MRLTLSIMTFLLCASLQAKTITIGMLPYEPPVSMKLGQQKNMVGFEAELVQTLCKRAKVQCAFKTASYLELFDLLRARKVDAIMGLIPIHFNRAPIYAYSLPYLPSYAVYVTKRANAEKNENPSNIKSAGIKNQMLFKALAKQTLGDNKNYSYQSNTQDLLEALADDRVDAVLLNSHIAHYWVKDDILSLQTIGKEMPLGYGYGIVALKNNAYLITLFNKALLQIEHDGTYAKLYNGYLGL